MEKTGALDTIRTVVKSKLVKIWLAQNLMIVAWAFAFFWSREAAGFGTPAAIGRSYFSEFRLPALRVALCALS